MSSLSSQYTADKGGMLILGTLIGTAHQHSEEYFEGTSYASHGYPLGMLSDEAMGNVVSTFSKSDSSGKEIWKGEDWLKIDQQALSTCKFPRLQYPVQRFISGLGGHPRTLEILKQVLDEYDQVPKAISLKVIFDKMMQKVYGDEKDWFGIRKWKNSSAHKVALLLAFAGIPVDLENNLFTEDEPLKVRDLEELGLIAIRYPSRGMSEKWGLKNQVLMEVPTFFAAMLSPIQGAGERINIDLY